MNETCCASGKARVYYNIPIKGGLKYRLKGEKAWKTILADETLTTTCIVKNNAVTNYLVQGTFDISYGPEPLAPPDGTRIENFSKVILGPILWFEERAELGGFGLDAITALGRVNIRSQSGAYRYIVYFNYTVTRLDGQPDKKQFTVTGTETGTKYLEIEVDECPDVQTIPCKFDPAKEQYIDVEMIPYFPLPIPLPSYPINQDCIEINSVGNFVVIQKVTTRNYGPTGDNDPTVRRTEKIIKTVESPKGCPPPKVRVECCPNGICGQDKRCPKGTTCEVVCDGFKCCYKDGKLIRSIKL
jgi:hypothetical protein